MFVKKAVQFRQAVHGVAQDTLLKQMRVDYEQSKRHPDQQRE